MGRAMGQAKGWALGPLENYFCLTVSPSLCFYRLSFFYKNKCVFIKIDVFILKSE